MEKVFSLSDDFSLCKDEKELINLLKEKNISYQKGVNSLQFTYSLFDKPFIFRFFTERKKVYFFSASYEFQNETEEEKKDLEEKVLSLLVSQAGEAEEKKEDSCSWEKEKIYCEFHNQPESREGAFKKPNLFFRVSYEDVPLQEKKGEWIPYVVLIVFLLALVVGILCFALLGK